MTEIEPVTSRRALLGALTVASVATVSSVAASPWDAAIAALPFASTDEPVTLRRSGAGRSDSLFRYRNAEAFYASVERGFSPHRSDLLYQVGIVLQLGLSSHLFDVGFTDAWCARNLGLKIDKSLAYANATGFGHDVPDLERFAAFVSPYGKWRHPILHIPCECPYPDDEIRQLTRALLDRVREVTGHSRPRGRRGRSA